MSLARLKKDWKELIAKGDMKTAIDEVKKNLDIDSPNYNLIIGISSRFMNLRKETIGTGEPQNGHENQISKNLLDLIDLINESDIINSNASETKNTYFLGIAIENYQFLPKCENAELDLERIYTQLQERGLKEGKLLLNEQATKVYIELNFIKLMTSPDNLDAVIIYYAGYCDDDFWIPFDAKNNESASHIAFNSIKNYCNQIKASEKIVFVDATYINSDNSLRSKIQKIPFHHTPNQPIGKYHIYQGSNQLIELFYEILRNSENIIEAMSNYNEEIIAAIKGKDELTFTSFEFENLIKKLIDTIREEMKFKP